MHKLQLNGQAMEISNCPYLALLTSAQEHSLPTMVYEHDVSKITRFVSAEINCGSDSCIKQSSSSSSSSEWLWMSMMTFTGCNAGG